MCVVVVHTKVYFRANLIGSLHGQNPRSIGVNRFTAVANAMEPVLVVWQLPQGVSSQVYRWLPDISWSRKASERLERRQGRDGMEWGNREEMEQGGGQILPRKGVDSATVVPTES